MQVTSSARAVGPVGDDLERDGLTLAVEDDLGRGHFEPLEVRPGSRRPWRPPRSSERISRYCQLSSSSRLPPLWGMARVGFCEDLADLGGLEVDALGRPWHQRLVVRLEVVAEEREAEAAAPLERAVARAARCSPRRPISGRTCRWKSGTSVTSSEAYRWLAGRRTAVLLFSSARAAVDRSSAGDRGERERSVHGWRSPFVVVAAGSVPFASALTFTGDFGFDFGLEAASSFRGRFCCRACWPFFTKAW